MQTRAIGSLSVGVVGLGCNNFGGRLDLDRTRQVVDAAIDAGVTLLDTADIYGGTRSEEFLGEILAGRRERVILATKFGGQVGEDPASKGGSARWVRQACDDSLRRLQTDRIDLYQFHFPDSQTPIDETLGALDELVRAGKVREIGNSNFSGDQIAEAESISGNEGWARFSCAQNQYSLLRREIETDTLPACEKHDLAMLPYFPLASGLLTGKYARGQQPPEGARLTTIPAERAKNVLNDENLAIVEQLRAFCDARGRTLLELAFSWLLGQPAVASVIAGATTPEQVRANVAATGWDLTEDERAEVARITARGLPPQG